MLDKDKGVLQLASGRHVHAKTLNFPSFTVAPNFPFQLQGKYQERESSFCIRHHPGMDQIYDKHARLPLVLDVWREERKLMDYFRTVQKFRIFTFQLEPKQMIRKIPTPNAGWTNAQRSRALNSIADTDPARCEVKYLPSISHPIKALLELSVKHQTKRCGKAIRHWHQQSRAPPSNSVSTESTLA